MEKAKKQLCYSISPAAVPCKSARQATTCALNLEIGIRIVTLFFCICLIQVNNCLRKTQNSKKTRLQGSNITFVAFSSRQQYQVHH